MRPPPPTSRDEKCQAAQTTFFLFLLDILLTLWVEVKMRVGGKRVQLFSCIEEIYTEEQAKVVAVV